MRERREIYDAQFSLWGISIVDSAGTECETATRICEKTSLFIASLLTYDKICIAPVGEELTEIIYILIVLILCYEIINLMIYVIVKIFHRFSIRKSRDI